MLDIASANTAWMQYYIVSAVQIKKKEFIMKIDSSYNHIFAVPDWWLQTIRLDSCQVLLWLVLINGWTAIHYSTMGTSCFAPLNNRQEQSLQFLPHIFSSQMLLSQPTLQVTALIQHNMVVAAHFTPADNRQVRETVNKRFNSHHTAQATRTMQLRWGFTSIALTVVP